MVDVTLGNLILILRRVWGVGRLIWKVGGAVGTGLRKSTPGSIILWKS